MFPAKFKRSFISASIKAVKWYYNSADVHAFRIKISA